MNAVLLLIDGALTIIEKVLPGLAAMVGTGEITVEQQKDVMRRVAALRQDAAFTGPEWEVTDPNR